MGNILTGIKFRKIAVLVFFLCFFVWGLSVYDDYGISSDEETERESSLITFAYIFPEVREKYDTETAPFSTYPDLTKWRDRYYGTAVQQPMVFVEYLNGFQMTEEQIYHMRHLYTFLVFFAAVIVFYFICRRIFGDTWTALLGAAMLVLTPRILANSFYNIKDIMALSFLIFSSYFAVRYIEKISVSAIIGLAFFGAVATNVRIVCALVIAAALIVAFVKNASEGNWKKAAVYCCLTGILSLTFYILITPILWHDTLNGLVNTVKTFASYESWYGSNFYMGEWVSGSVTPWHYMLVWIGITTPVIYLMLCLFGVISLPVRRIKNVGESCVWNWNLIYFLTIIAVPLLYAVLRKPVFYNGWRHYYFIYPAIVILAVWGFSGILKFLETKTWAKRAEWSLMGIYLGLTGFWIIRNHPYENVYFNTIGRIFAEDNFEKDYYYLSEYQGIQTLLDLDDSQHIKVWVRTPNIRSRVFLPEEDQARIERGNIGALDESDYIIYCYDEPGLEYDLFDKIYEESVDGIPIYGIFRRTYARIYDSVIQWDDSAVMAKINDISWHIESEADSDEYCFIGELGETTYADLVYLSGEGLDLSEVKTQYSADGLTWKDMTGELEWGEWTLRTEDEAWKYIRICAESGIGPTGSLNLRIYSKLENGEDSTSHQNVISASKSDYQQENAQNAYDTDISTVWSTKVKQTDGISFDVQLQDIYEISQLTLYAESDKETPQGLTILYSTDGDQYSAIEDIQTEDNRTFGFAPVNCDYLEFVLSDIPENVTADWTIADIVLYGKISDR